MSAPSIDARRAATGTLALGLVQSVGRAAALVFLAVTTRVVAPQEFGRYSIVAGLVAFVGFLADFGSTTVVTRAVGREPGASEDLLGETVLGSFAVGLLAYGAVILYAVLVGGGGVLVGAVAVGGLAIVFDAVLTSVLGALDGRGLIVDRAWISFVRIGVMMLAGALGVAVVGGIWPAIVALAAGPAVALVLALAIVRRRGVWTLRLRVDVGRTLWLFRTACPFALLGGIGAVVARLDLLVLSAVGSRAETARYDLALRSVEAATALAAVIGAPALYILSRRLGAGDLDGARRAHREAVRMAHLVGLPLTAVIVGLHRWLVDVAFGPEFRQSAVLLAVLGLTVWPTVVSGAQGAVVLAGESAGQALRWFGGLLVGFVALVAVLVPTFGAMGAACASVLAVVSAGVIFDRLNRRALGIVTPVPSTALLVICAVATLVMLVCSWVGPAWSSACCLPAFGYALWRSGIIGPNELGRLRVLVAGPGR